MLTSISRYGKHEWELGMINPSTFPPANIGNQISHTSVVCSRNHISIVQFGGITKASPARVTIVLDSHPCHPYPGVPPSWFARFRRLGSVDNAV